MATQEAAPLDGIEISAAAPPAPTSVHEPQVRPWELELLLSLSLVFALMQLPSYVDGVFGAVEPRLDRNARMVAFALYEFVKLPLYLMIAAFLLHLAARAYWVGLIGLEAVFPAGVRWDSLPYGPVTKEVQRERITSLQPMIDRADRFGSIIFSTSLAMVVTFAFGGVFTAVAAAISFGVSTLFFGGRHLALLYGATIVAILLPSFVVKTLDQRIGATLPQGSRARRWLRRGAVMSFYNAGGAAVSSVWLILFSNLNRKVVSAALAVVFVSLFTFFIVKDVLLPAGVLTADSYAYLPDETGPRSMQHASYENLRPAGGSYEEAPSIQSDVVSGPYVRLFLPYLPRRLNPAMAKHCPGLPALGGGGLRMQGVDPTAAPAGGEERVLRCWASLQPVKLNGQVVQPRFRFYTHPQTGVRGVVAYLPTETMPRGENVLEIAAIQRSGDGVRRPPRAPSFIPFWR